MQVRRTEDERTSHTAGYWLVRIGCLLSFYLAMMGDWPDLNRAVGGVPKIMSLGVVGVAVLHLLIVGDFKRCWKTMRFAPVFFSLILMLMLWSLVVWMLQFTTKSSVTRGISKMMYQSFTIMNVLCCVYLCGEDAILVFFSGLCMANASIMVLEVPKFGLAASINSTIHCLVTFGDAQGYIKQLELHDITFTFGQCLIYWLMFAKRSDKRERRVRRIAIGLCLFFMLIGLKRATFPTVAGVALLVWLLRKRKRPLLYVMLGGIFLFLFSFYYIWIVREGIFTQLLKTFNIDMLGRDEMWMRTNSFYEFSPLYMGRGFEAVSNIVAEWVRTGVMKKSLPFHNDFLKAFVELGFGGYTLWYGTQCIAYPLYWGKKHGSEAALMYFSVFLYMSVTYLTDNTAFYYWSTTGLRLFPLAYVVGRLQVEAESRRWMPPDALRISDEVWSGD